MNILKLSEYFDLCVAFETEPQNPNRQIDIDDFLSQLIVKEYLPIKDKVMAAMKIASTISDNYDAAFAAGQLEISRVVNGLLLYCSNLENDLGTLALTFACYDAIQIHGLAESVYSRCAKDYDCFVKMLDSMIDISNIKSLTRTAQLINYGDYDKWIETLEDYKKTLTPDLIKQLIAFNEQTSGVARGVRDLADKVAEEMYNLSGRDQADGLIQADSISRMKDSVLINRVDLDKEEAASERVESQEIETPKGLSLEDETDEDYDDRFEELTPEE